MRVKRGIVRHAKHKKVLKSAKGYIGRKKSVFKLAKQASLKAGQNAYRDRKKKKSTFRSLWIVKINAAARAQGYSYSEFMKKLTDANITLNRKHLAHLAEFQPEAFKEIIKKVK